MISTAREALAFWLAKTLCKWKYIPRFWLFSSLLRTRDGSVLKRKQLTSKINSVPTAQKRFINGYPNTNFDWKAIYELPLKVTVDITTRQFQYKLLHRTLYFNKALFKMNIADTNKCTFCNDFDETIAHLMFQCTHSLSFWSDVVDWLKEFKI